MGRAAAVSGRDVAIGEQPRRPRKVNTPAQARLPTKEDRSLPTKDGQKSACEHITSRLEKDGPVVRFFCT